MISARIVATWWVLSQSTTWNRNSFGHLPWSKLFNSGSCFSHIERSIYTDICIYIYIIHVVIYIYILYIIYIHISHISIHMPIVFEFCLWDGWPYSIPWRSNKHGQTRLNRFNILPNLSRKVYLWVVRLGINQQSERVWRPTLVNIPREDSTYRWTEILTASSAVALSSQVPLVCNWWNLPVYAWEDEKIRGIDISWLGRERER